MPHVQPPRRRRERPRLGKDRQAAGMLLPALARLPALRAALSGPGSSLGGACRALLRCQQQVGVVCAPSSLGSMGGGDTNRGVPVWWCRLVVGRCLAWLSPPRRPTCTPLVLLLLLPAQGAPTASTAARGFAAAATNPFRT